MSPRAKGRRAQGAWIEATKWGSLRICFRWPRGQEGKLHRITTQYKDREADRKELGKIRNLIGAEIRSGVFDPAKRFPSRFGPRVVIQPLRETVTFGSFYEGWIESVAGLRVRVTKVRDYKGHWKNYLRPVLEDVDLRALSVGHIADIRRRLVAKDLSEKTIRNSIDSTLRAMCRDAKREGHQVGWPFDQLEWEDYVPEREADPFTEEERDRILAAFAKKRWRAAKDPGATARSHAYLATLFKTGMRPSEVAALRIGDVDFAAGTILVRRSRNFGSEAAPKTRAARRIVRLDPELVQLLRRIAPATGKMNEYVFRNHSGDPIDQRNFDDSLRAVLRALGIRVRGLYQTKHTYASIALSKNVNPKWVAEQLGITLATLERHYGRFMHSRAADRAEIEKMFPRAFASAIADGEKPHGNPTQPETALAHRR